MAAAVGKRKLDEVVESAVAIIDSTKRAREGSPEAKSNGALVATKIKTGGAVLPAGVKRTSALESPTMLLTGHSGEVFSVQFSPDGNSIVSGSYDRNVLLWRTYGECENYMMLSGHGGPIMEVCWTRDGSHILSASVDKSIALWDSHTGARLKRMKGHTAIVNSCSASPRLEMCASGSDDGTVKIWDSRKKNAVTTLNCKYQVTSVCFDGDGQKLYSGGIDNVIKCWDLRKNEEELTMPGHQDTITGLAMSPDGNFLLSNAMDNTVRMWDVRPYKAGDRQVKAFTGAQHNFEKNLLRCNWSADGKMVTAGSADRMVYVWDVQTQRILYRLPGHSGSVNETCFHPTEPIIASCSSDKNIYVGELAD